MKKLSQPPNPQEAKQKLLKAIQTDAKADWLLYEAIRDASVTLQSPLGTPIIIKVYPTLRNLIKEYREAFLTLSSPEGRKYIRKHLDEILNYIEKLVSKG